MDATTATQSPRGIRGAASSDCVVLFVAAAISPVAATLGNIDTAGDFRVFDVAATLVVHREVLADLVDFDVARSVVFDDDRAPHIRREETTRSVALDDERS